MRHSFPIQIITVLAALIVLAAWSGFPAAAQAQSLVERYRAARFKAQADRVLEGFHAQAIPATRLDYPTDSLRRWVDLVLQVDEVPHEAAEQTAAEPAITVTRWESVPKLGRDWFRNKFVDARWSFEGSNSLSTLDTTFTRDLRARLQAEFGSPTQTIADLDYSEEAGTTEYIQFEYWFVLNDTIPLRVMDVNGPFERGLVIASLHEYRSILPDIKDVFLGRLSRADARAAYVDYYHLPEQRLWFLTGYDGEKYFIDRISKPDLKLGRPLLSSERN